MAKTTIFSFLLLILTLFMTSSYKSSFLVSGDIAADRTECADQLVGLSPCLLYVQGQAKAPTPDCCTGLKQVLVKSPKCLCVLIRDRDDPNLGIQLNVSLALSLPSVCNLKANTSRCPELLNIPPNSKDAAIFEQGGNASTPAAPATSTTSSNQSSSSHRQESSNGRGIIHLRRGSWFGLMALVVCYLLLLLPSFDPSI